MKTLILMFCLSLFASNFAAAHDAKPMSKEQRTKMADLYDKIAGCLRSDASDEECHKQMHAAMAACEEACGGQCPLMSHDHHKKAKAAATTETK